MRGGHGALRIPVSGGVTRHAGRLVGQRQWTRRFERVEFTGTDGEVASDLKKSEIIAQRRGKAKTRIRCKPEIIADSVFNALGTFRGLREKNLLAGDRCQEDFIKEAMKSGGSSLNAVRATRRRRLLTAPGRKGAMPA